MFTTPLTAPLIIYVGVQWPRPQPSRTGCWSLSKTLSATFLPSCSEGLDKELGTGTGDSPDAGVFPPAQSTTRSTMSSPESAAAGTSSTCTASCGPQWCLTWSACSWELSRPPSSERTRTWWVLHSPTALRGWKLEENQGKRFKGAPSLWTSDAFI